MNLVSISARNVLRNKGRTSLTVLGAVVAVTAFVLLRTVLWAWNVAVEHAAKDRIASRHKVSFILSLPRNYIDTVRAQPGIKTATWANWFGGKDPRYPNEFFASIAIDPHSFFEVYDEMVVPPDQKQGWLEDRRGAIVGDVLARKLGVKVGDRITLQGTIYPGDWQFNVRGIYTAARKSVDRSQFLFHWEYMNQSVPERIRDQIGWIISRIEDPSQGAAMSAAIDKVFDDKGIQTATMSERALNLSFMASFSAVLSALDIVSIIILVIMMMILGNTIAMGVRERTHEYGVLRAVGFLPKHIAWSVLGEAATIGAIAGALGLAAAYPFVELVVGRWLEEYMGAWFPYFRIAPETAATAFVLPIGLAVVASILPAYRASQLSVTDALRRVA